MIVTSNKRGSIYFIILIFIIFNNQFVIYTIFIGETGPVLTHRRSWVENTNMSMKGSFTDLSNLDLDSVNSTPAMQRVSINYKINCVV